VIPVDITRLLAAWMDAEVRIVHLRVRFGLSWNDVAKLRKLWGERGRPVPMVTHSGIDYRRDLARRERLRRAKEACKLGSAK